MLNFLETYNKAEFNFATCSCNYVANSNPFFVLSHSGEQFSIIQLKFLSDVVCMYVLLNVYDYE